MDKITTFDFDGRDNFYSVIAGSSSLIKLASNLSMEITDFIKNQKFDTKKYVYVLINALGAEEYYGPNKNGDGFPEYYESKSNLINDGREYGYKTFQHNAKLYKHHVNKDPAKSYGDVLLSIYNQGMHRVELIVRMDREKAPDECRKAEAGEIVSTSMGTKVPYDVCSICGNKAKTRDDYCCHLRESMGKILPDGRKIYAINPFPKFFDISLVFVPADVTSRVLIKIAEDKTALKEIIADEKEAEIEKEVPGGDAETVSIDDLIEMLIQKKTRIINNRDEEIPTEVINSISKHPLNKILSTLACMGILPKPKEFQRIILIKINKPQIADMLDKQNVVFDQDKYDIDDDLLQDQINVDFKDGDNSIFNMLENFMPSRSMWQPHLIKRLIGYTKTAATNTEQTADNLIPIMLAVAGLYAIFKGQFAPAVIKQLAAEIVEHPILIGGIYNYMSRDNDPHMSTFGNRVVSTGTENASELLKVSSYLNTLMAKNAGLLGATGKLIGGTASGAGKVSLDLIKNFLLGRNPLAPIPGYAKDLSNFSKDIAQEGGQGLYSLLGDAANEGFGFMPRKGTPEMTSALRRLGLAAPVLAYGSGSAEVDRVRGKEEGFVKRQLRENPGKLLAAAVLLGGEPAHALKTGFGGKLASIDPLLNPDEDTVKLLLKFGTLLDVATLIQLGKLS